MDMTTTNLLIEILTITARIQRNTAEVDRDLSPTETDASFLAERIQRLNSLLSNGAKIPTQWDA